MQDNLSGVNGLTALGAVNLVDSTLATFQKSGYQLATYATARSTTQPATMIVGGHPTTASGVTATGARHFLVATDGLIMADTYVGTTMDWDNSGAPITITGGTAIGN